LKRNNGMMEDRFMNARTLILRIQRFQQENDPPRWIETFQVETRKRMNLLEALLRVQDEQDGTLSFRYSCRGAVCGSCAMKVNGSVVLACRTHVEDLLEKPAFIEPLPYFPVLRDLIVDMSAFFAHYREIEPFLHGKPVPSHQEYFMDEEKRKEIDPYINCILCGICFGVCPAFERDPQYLGPAMLAKAYRFLLDPRDERSKEILERIDNYAGVWGCNTVFRCVKVCPKEVPPTHAILNIRKKILRHRLRSILPFLPSQSK
ncbi:MAG TPA: succinate dehydrogenase/fumarate reductase iron-sulfur subunit, partial [Thermodesulfobacteriota bacterium]|nr:succinate dehydrogenase/fumarate reductase iron-sulfur subunit [Thermodesulfobacteriota bacterium]